MKIICIGRNYVDHAKEMNAEVPKEPVFFLKPDTALLRDNEDFYYPDFTKDLHYECELVLKIDKVGKNISEKFANKYYSKIGLGIDFTARDLQGECKKKGLPWEIGKAFDSSAPLSSKWLDKDIFTNKHIEFGLQLNDSWVQRGNSQEMLFSFDQIISYISSYMTLKTGDLIYTGTPAGVGPVKIGDQLKGFIGEEEMFNFSIK